MEQKSMGSSAVLQAASNARRRHQGGGKEAVEAGRCRRQGPVPPAGGQPAALPHLVWLHTVMRPTPGWRLMTWRWKASSPSTLKLFSTVTTSLEKSETRPSVALRPSSPHGADSACWLKASSTSTKPSMVCLLACVLCCKLTPARTHWVHCAAKPSEAEVGGRRHEGQQQVAAANGGGARSRPANPSLRRRPPGQFPALFATRLQIAASKLPTSNLEPAQNAHSRAALAAITDSG